MRSAGDKLVKLNLSEDGVLDLGREYSGAPLPEHVMAAVEGSLDRGETHYTTRPGLPELARAVAEKLEREQGLSLDPSLGVIISTGECNKTIVTTQASAKLDSRCPPNLEPVDQLKLLEKHLDKHGFDDIEIVTRAARPNPYKTPVREAISQSIIHAAERVWGEEPVVAGVSTQGIIMIHVPLPAVLSGFGAPENNLHAPNENMPVDRCLQGIKFAATIFQEFADRT